MKHTNRPFLIALLLTLILVCGVGASQPVKNGPNSMLDCAQQCRGNYDAAVERCNRLPDAKGEKCREMAQKRYDNCLDRCRGGGSAPSPGL
jgi:hypothetical protein